MLSLDLILRIVRNSMWNGQFLSSPSLFEQSRCDRLLVSPFENPYPWHPLSCAGVIPVAAASSADADLLRAAYFATFPAVD